MAVLAEAPIWQESLPALPASVRAFQGSAMAANTQSAYRSDWRQFAAWCRTHARPVMPADPELVAEYLADMASRVDALGRWRYAPSTLGRRLAAIGKVHELAGHLSPVKHPVVATTMAGIRRERIRPTRRMAPLLLADLRAVLGHIDLFTYPAGVIGRRDAALLLMGFSGAFRRSELSELTVADISRHTEDGLHIRMLKSKTDQEGRGAVKALPFGDHPQTCPPCALARWVRVLAAFHRDGRVGVLRALRASKRTNVPTHVCRSVGQVDDLPGDSPLFRPVHKTGAIGAGPLTGQAINEMVKRRVAAAGFDQERFGGHSLRAGFVTQAARAGADAASIMRQTGHRSAAMIEVYRRENAPLIGNAVTTIGL